jgi:hypothetical protein
MPKNVKIKFGNLKIEAQLNESKTAELIYEKLPLEGQVKLWGEEVYFEIPVMTDLEEPYAKDVVELGDMGYWPQGAAFCIFFGQTPISQPGAIKPLSTVNVVGHVLGDTKLFRNIRSSDTIIIDNA